MKHKLKRILKLNIFVLGMLILLTNCQTEDLVLKNESITKSKAVVTKLNYEQFLRQQNVKSTVEKLKRIELTKISNSKNRNNTQRAVVTIDSSSINQVIKDGVVSYTFKVVNSDLEANTFENLVIQTDTTQQTNAFLIKYIPSISLYMGIPFEGIKEVTPLDSSTTINTTNKTTVCVSITTYTNYYLCDEGVVQSPETCDYQYTTENTETSCETLPEGNSNSTVFYSNPTSGGGGSPTPDSDYDGSDTGIHGNGGTPINTAPLFDENQTINDPCNKLKNLFNTPKPDIKSTVQNHLQTDIPINPNGEKAAYLQKLPDGTMGTTVSAPTSTNEVKIRTGGNFYSAIHTHNTGLYPMFSYSDVIVLNDLNNNIQSHNQGMASFLLVCQDDSGVFQTYAIVFEANELNNSLNYFLNTPENNGCTQNEVKAEIDERLGREFAKDSNYERIFLKFMKHTNVSVYKANSTLTNWSKLSLSKGFSNSVASTPCN